MPRDHHICNHRVVIVTSLIQRNNGSKLVKKKSKYIYIYVYWVQTVSHLMIVLLKDERYIWGNAGNQKKHNSAAFFFVNTLYTYTNTHTHVKSTNVCTQPCRKI